MTNGKGHDSVKWSAECFKERSGTHTSDVTWTQPPDYMEPGSNISFSMTFTSPFYDIPIGGGIYANGVMFLEGRSTNPDGKSMATYTVPDGSPGDELEVYTSFIVISGLHGYVTCKYKYQGAGAVENPTDKDSPESHPLDVISEEANEPSSDIAGGTNIISNPTDNDESVSKVEISKPIAFITKIDGKGLVWIDGVPIEPAAKDTPIAEGSRITTGPDTSVVVTFKTTEFLRVMPNSESVIRMEKLAEADTSIIYENL